MTTRRLTEFERLLQQLNEIDSTFYQSLLPDDRRFLHNRLEGLPYPIQKVLFDNYRSEPNIVNANKQLRIVSAEIRQILPVIFRIDFDMCEKRRRDLAEEHSRRMHRIFMREHNKACLLFKPEFLKVSALVSETNSEIAFAVSENVSVISEMISETVLKNSEMVLEIPETVSEILSEKSLEFPNAFQKPVNAQLRANSGDFGKISGKDTLNAQLQAKGNQWGYFACAAYMKQLGLQPSKLTRKTGFAGCLKRMQDAVWWRRQLRQVQKRKTEQVMALLGKVSKRAGKYCSDITLKNRLAEKMASAAFMGRTFVVNQDQQRYSLKEISDKNVSNPTIRKGELMTRMRGTEDIAKELGHIGSFVTLTCPSKYHCAYASSGDRNPNWSGATPYQAQQYLNQVWARIRAELARQEIQIYGLRVAEPQHDGTPHWHMMLFMAPDHLSAFRTIFMQYALAEDGDEKGAQENRVKLVDIDPNKGSATGYIAKYISKNIDGQGLDSDIGGGDATIAAQRVEAWSSCWGIRQFQQIGGVPVTPWRELRRLKEGNEIDEQFETVRAAADKSDWKSYVHLMGGVFCKRKDLLIRPYYDVEADQQTGLIKTSWFDDLITFKLKGVLYLGKAIITRLHQWRLEQAVGRSSPLLGVL
jgi:hypothetical protein